MKSSSNVFRRFAVLAGGWCCALGLEAAVVSATYNSPTDVPLVAGSIPPGDTVAFTLNFAPAVGTELRVVTNPGLSFLQGAFANLTQGQGVPLNFGGVTYNFVANYYGGTGNDLVLVWANTAWPVAWGGNNYGEQGNNTLVKNVAPAAVLKSGVLLNKTLVALSAGIGHSLALAADGTLAAWGWGLYSQLGNGNITNSTVPVLVNTSGGLASERVVAISAGYRFNLALTASGKVVAWGENDAGQLGNNTNNGNQIPQGIIATGVLANKSVVAISAGFNHSLALCADGTVVAWGNNSAGQVGANSTATQIKVPALVETAGVLAGRTVVAISAGHNHSLALCSDGVMVAWGWNIYGQLGTSSLTQSTVPVLVNMSGVLSGKTVAAIAAGLNHSLALCTDGTLAAWGTNGAGQLGNNSTTASNTPIAIAASGVLAGKTVVGIVGGASHSMALCSDGTVATWGDNFYGQLGNSSATASLVPVAVNTAGLGTGAVVTRLFGGEDAFHALALVAAPPAPVPEIEVLGNAVVIPHGATAASLSDHTSFGQVAVAGNASLTRTYTIRNAGSADLNLTGSPDRVVLGGGNAAADFAVTAVPLAVVPAQNGTMTFQVTFNPSAAGMRTTTVSIATDDSDENPYVFTLQGEGVVPEIAVLGNGVIIASGSASPSLANHTDFGVVATAGNATQVRTFTVKNTGGANLNLNGLPDRVAVSGPHAADFTVTQTPSALVPALGGTTTFQVTFNPSAVGLRTATLSLANDDSDENPTTFAIQGTGGLPEIEVRAGNPAAAILNGDLAPSAGDDSIFADRAVSSGASAPHVFTVHNLGDAPLTIASITSSNAAEFPVGALSAPLPATVGAGGTLTFEVRFNPSVANLRTGQITIANDDSDEGSYVFAVQGNGTLAPDIVVQDGPTLFPILNGDLAPSLADHTDFGSFPVNGGLVGPHYFNIRNLGNAPLVITSLTSSQPAEFLIIGTSQAFPATLAPNNSMFFGLYFNPSGPGLRTGTLTILSNDSDENPYVFAVQGNGTVAPEIGVRGNLNNIPNGDLTPGSFPNDLTDFGGFDVSGGATAPYTFTIHNFGNGPLTVTAITSGNSAEFPVTATSQPLPATVPASGSMTFAVAFDPSAPGPRTSLLAIASDDASANPYTFAVQGNGLVIGKPNVEVFGNSVPIFPGDPNPALTDGTDFGGTVTTPVSHTFSVVNAGVATLTLGSVVVSGAQASDFTVTTPPAATVGGSSATQFIVSFVPSGPGLRTATLSFATNVPTKNPYTFAVQGTGYTWAQWAPNMSVAGNNVVIADGDGAPSSSDFTHFGSTPVTGGVVTRTFTIRNNGPVALNLTGTPRVLVGGVHAADFTVTQPTAATVPSGGTVNFSVTFNPSGYFYRSATLSIPNNDTPRNPYNFAVRGTGSLAHLFGGSGWAWTGQTTRWVPVTSATGGIERSDEFWPAPGATRSFAWGTNEFGQLGAGGAIEACGPSAVSTAGILAARTMLEVAAGQGHSVALATDGTLAAWGQGGSGQLGNAALGDSAGPVAVDRSGVLAGRTVVALAAGQAHTLALCSDGTVVAWGANGSGQLGNGTTTASAVPILLPATGALAGKTVISVAAGERHSVALCTDGTVVAWGDNSFGQLGNGTKVASAVPVASLTTGAAAVLSGRTVVAIAAGAAHTLVACADGAVAAWGRNHAGQLGDNSAIDRLVPGLVATTGALGGKIVVAIAAGGAHSLALCSDDTVVAWGENRAGQLGNGATVGSAVPVAVDRSGSLSGQTVIAITAGAANSYALTAEGAVAAWGDNALGQLAGSGLSASPVPVSVGLGRLEPGSRFTRIVSGASSSHVLGLAAAPAPQIGVAANAVPILDGQGSGRVADQTDFGSAIVNGGTVTRTFTVTNGGGATLNLTGTPRISVSGPQAGDFTVSSPPASSVLNPGAATTFTVVFAPLGVGARSAQVTVATDDPAHPAFAFGIQGMGAQPGGLELGGNLNANNVVYTSAAQPDGKHLLGGNFTTMGPAAAPSRVARLNADGTLDLTFNPAANDLVAAVAVLPDGATVLGGAFTTVGGVGRNRLARVDGNGSLDGTFNPDADGAISAIAVQSDGKLVIAGAFANVGGTARSKVARLLASGAVDPGFDPNANRTVYTAAVQADGKVILGGNFDRVGGVTRNRVARVNPDGTLDAAFNPGPNSDVTCLAIQADGKIVIGGQFSAVGGVTRNRVARLLPDGSLDPDFDPNVDSAVYSLAAQADGKVVIGGSFNNVGGVARVRVARLRTDGSLDPLVDAATDDVVFSTALQADGKIVLAGYFTSVGGVPRNFLARLENDAAPQNLAVVGANRVVWLRGGSAPETQQVSFERSIDGGLTWLLLGAGVRVAGGWELSGLNFSGQGWVRARARTTGGAYTGSTGLVESVAAYSIAALPVITTQPVSQSVAAGATVTFSVAASGLPSPSYLWRKGGAAGSVAIAGATSATLTLPNAQAADAGSYLVVVTNSAGSVTSAVANLVVNTAGGVPAITTQPLGQTAVAGSPVALTVAAGGGPGLSYLWRKGGTAIPGATTATLAFTSVAVTDAGTYEAVVGNAAGTVVSQPATLLVLVPPAIVTPPAPQGAGLGTGVVLRVAATGSEPLTYQWVKDGASLAGATSSSLALAGVSATSAGIYRVVVSNPAGSVVSDPATLVVIDAVATHAVAGPGYVAGGTVAVTNTLTYGAATSALGWQVLLPSGWTYATGSGNEGDVRPAVGTGSLLEWAWTSIPNSPLTFTYVLNVPAGTSGERELAALAIVRESVGPAQILAKPDPLRVGQLSTHSADTNRDLRIGLLELTRVIELYNTRLGSSRTGCYSVQDGSEDGFAPDPTRAGSTVVTLLRYHHADFSLDGRISLLELTRVIELYNFRSGTSRTGQYHLQAGTEDGFAPGP